MQSPNKLLAALPAREYAPLLPHLQTVEFAEGEELPDSGLKRVYFLENGLCSIGSAMEDRRMVELVWVGREGIIGLPLFLGVPPATPKIYRHLAPASAQVMLLDVFEREMARRGGLCTIVQRYTRLLLDTIVQNALCSRVHTLQSRCARWLLAAADRLETPDVQCSRKALASALAAEPAEFAVVLRRLDELGAISLDRGHLRIIHRKVLERLTCDCYWRIILNVPTVVSHSSETQQRGSARVLKLRHVTPCGFCQSTINLPHFSEHDCIRVIDQEVRQLLVRSRTLRRKRKILVEHRLSAMRTFLAKIRG
jgi:CRP-like cAMP-binding protein